MPQHINEIGEKSAGRIASCNLIRDDYHEVIQTAAVTLTRHNKNSAVYITQWHGGATCWYDGDSALIVKADGTIQ